MRKILTLSVLSALLLLPSLQGGDGGRLSAKRRVHTIGDSTMSDYKPAATPKRGWGMYLQADYLIIQFAHNDEKCKGEDVYVQNARLRAEGKDTLTDMRGTEPNTTYKAYLRKFINEAREMGVTPILMSPICRAYFKDGKINAEGRHDLSKDGIDKNYVRCMREVAEDMHVPFLDMTQKSCEMYETTGQERCMKDYFNCGDKTHTGQAGGFLNAHLAYLLIKNCPQLSELHHLVALPPLEVSVSYIRAIEEKGRLEAFKADGTPFATTLKNAKTKNMKLAKAGYAPSDGLWPAGEIDEVANRYIEYTITAEKKKGIVIESIILPVKAKGGPGMNIHINYGFGDEFRNVTTIYENTALPKNKPVLVSLDYPILIPAGETLHLRILPWFDSNGRPQGKKFLSLGELKIDGKKLK